MIKIKRENACPIALGAQKTCALVLYNESAPKWRTGLKPSKLCFLFRARESPKAGTVRVSGS